MDVNVIYMSLHTKLSVLKLGASMAQMDGQTVCNGRILGSNCNETWDVLSHVY